MKTLFCCLAVAVAFAVCRAETVGDVCADRRLAFHSSTYRAREAADKAVDDNVDPDSSKGGCTHTATDDMNPWVIVDLGCSKKVTKVKVVNRKDSSYRLSDFVISIHEKLPNPAIRDCSRQCVYQKDALPVGPSTLTCETPMNGKYVLLRFRDPASKAGYARYIHICDLNVE